MRRALEKMKIGGGNTDEVVAPRSGGAWATAVNRRCGLNDNQLCYQCLAAAILDLSPREGALNWEGYFHRFMKSDWVHLSKSFPLMYLSFCI
jgi:hypothetical protein